MHRLLMALVLGSLATACASSGQARMQASTLPPCMTRPELEGWHQVSGDGVTFCVPEDWSSMGRRAWHGDGGRIRWAPGAKPFRIESRVVRVAVPRGAPPPTMPSPDIRIVYNTHELVGEAQVDLWIIERKGTFETGASWNTGTPLHMAGEAPNQAAADLQMKIYRSVRVETQ
ncbi:MAG: hypothetical protein P8Z36_15280 [Gemmatimonadota bacterium]|jgi:hypothetical protein